MKIGVDLDGIITPVGFINPSVRLPQWLYILFVPIILLMFPTKRKELRKIKVQGHTIIIISARPKWCENLTRMWLKYHGISFTKIYCVGFGKGTKQRKLKIIEKEEVKIFIENDERIRKFLYWNSIEVISEFNQLNGRLEKRAIFYYILTMPEKIGVHIFVSGKVQGVFFRSHTVKKARDLGITGWVSNLEDGRVEAVFEGEEKKVKEIIEWVKRGPTFARVDNVEIEWQDCKGEFNDFAIKYD